MTTDSQADAALDYFRIHTQFTLEESELVDAFEKAQRNFCVLFFQLSEPHKLLDEKTFRKSYLRASLAKFTEKDLYYLYAGILNQLGQGFDDFYMLFHHFLLHLDSRPFQNLMSTLFSNLNKKSAIKLNECIVSNDLLGKCLQKVEEPTNFHLKFLVFISQNRNPVVVDYVKSLQLSLIFRGINGSKAYFKNWYINQNAGGVRIVFG